MVLEDPRQPVGDVGRRHTTRPDLSGHPVSRRADLPSVTGTDDAARATWLRADTYDELVTQLASRYGGEVFAAHRSLLAEALA